jgi:hypothetical protein
MGVFWDTSGDDTYASKGTTLGQASISAPAGNVRRLMRCIGVFVDGGGTDRYPEEKSAATNGSCWTQQGPNKLPTELGVGVDK